MLEKCLSTTAGTHGNYSFQGCSQNTILIKLIPSEQYAYITNGEVHKIKHEFKMKYLHMLYL